MKPGDIVRFRDVSSGASEGKGYWTQFDGKPCVVVKDDVNHLGMIEILVCNEIGRFSPQYLEEIK